MSSEELPVVQQELPPEVIQLLRDLTREFLESEWQLFSEHATGNEGYELPEVIKRVQKWVPDLDVK